MSLFVPGIDVFSTCGNVKMTSESGVKIMASYLDDVQESHIIGTVVIKLLSFLLYGNYYLLLCSKTTFVFIK